MHPDPGGAPLTESRRTTKRARPRLGWADLRKKTRARIDSPALFLPRIHFRGDNDVAFFNVMYTQSTSFHSSRHWLC